VLFYKKLVQNGTHPFVEFLSILSLSYRLFPSPINIENRVPLPTGMRFSVFYEKII